MCRCRAKELRQARELALQALFQLDWNHAEAGEEEESYRALALGMVLGESGEIDGDISTYLNTLVVGTRENLPEIDATISDAVRDWRIERMASVDRNIARIAVFEMMFSGEKIRPGIAINEAVEIAKRYGTDDSGKFINGILGTVARRVFA